MGAVQCADSTFIFQVFIQETEMLNWLIVNSVMDIILDIFVVWDLESTWMPGIKWMLIKNEWNVIKCHLIMTLEGPQ